jgi:dihydrofolate reductase
MRKVILHVAVSLDGFIEGPKGEYDWCLTDQDYGISDLFEKVDTLFIGRKTYDLMQSVGEAAWKGFPRMKQYIFSNTLDSVKGGAILVRGDITEQVNKIRREPGKGIWLFGGSGLTTSLLTLGLVDEISLAVHPLVLGSGKALFRNIPERVPLTLLDSRSYSSGLVLLHYAVKN